MADRDKTIQRLAVAIGVKPERRELFRQVLDASRKDGGDDMLYFVLHLVARALSDMHGFGGERILRTIQQVYDYAEEIRDNWMSLEEVAVTLRQEKGFVMEQTEGGIAFSLFGRSRSK